MNRQAQSGSEPVGEPRATETVSFYTVRTKKTNGRLNNRHTKDIEREGGLLFGECEQQGVGEVWGHTFNIAIKPGLDVI